MKKLNEADIGVILIVTPILAFIDALILNKVFLAIANTKTPNAAETAGLIAAIGIGIWLPIFMAFLFALQKEKE